MATHSCLENPMDREPGRLQSMGSQRVRHDWVTKSPTAGLPGNSLPWFLIWYYWHTLAESALVPIYRWRNESFKKVSSFSKWLKVRTELDLLLQVRNLEWKISVFWEIPCWGREAKEELCPQVSCVFIQSFYKYLLIPITRHCSRHWGCSNEQKND